MKTKPNILIAGGTGLLGSQLSELLASKGYGINILSRDPSKSSKYDLFHWDPNAGVYDKLALQDVSTIINLAGAGVAEKPWTNKRKRIIVESRTKSADLIKKMLSESEHSVKTVVNASAIGYYGNRGDEILN